MSRKIKIDFFKDKTGKSYIKLIDQITSKDLSAEEYNSLFPKEYDQKALFEDITEFMRVGEIEVINLGEIDFDTVNSLDYVTSFDLSIKETEWYQLKGY